MQKDSISINLENVSVELPIYNSTSRSFRRALISSAVGGLIQPQGSIVHIRSLTDVSFSLREGDRLGVSGHNGAGKTTLLRVLAGAYTPTSGRIQLTGRVVSFIDIMLGMDVEYSGEENVFIRGLLYGLKKSTIQKKLDEIIEFSGLEDFIRLPMRTYSSGMMMRLAFAIATSIEADIVLMDEWLSVGDADFSKRAEVRLEQYLRNVGILVLASHSKPLLDKYCNKHIELTHGSTSSWTERSPTPTLVVTGS
jgi:lipopolysaccharide transport system ATP-binding protein